MCDLNYENLDRQWSILINKLRFKSLLRMRKVIDNQITHKIMHWILGNWCKIKHFYSNELDRKYFIEMRSYLHQQNIRLIQINMKKVLFNDSALVGIISSLFKTNEILIGKEWCLTIFTVDWMCIASLRFYCSIS